MTPEEKLNELNERIRAIEEAANPQAVISGIEDVVEFLHALSDAEMPYLDRIRRIGSAQASAAAMLMQSSDHEGLVQAANFTAEAAQSYQLINDAGSAAEMYYNLTGICYRIDAEQNPNGFELLIDAYDKAFEFFTENNHLNIWAKLKTNLVDVYIKRPTGDHAQNVERAIEHGEQALREIRRETMLIDWASVRISLGYAFGQRLIGPEQQNLDKAIELSLSGVHSLPETELTQLWALAQTNLSDIYFRRASNHEPEFFELAAESAHNALRFFTQHEFPYQWAVTQMNLGSAIQSAPGSMSENSLAEAIEAYQKAQSFFTPSTHPETWSNIQIKRAALIEQGQLGIRKDTTDSIALIEEALTALSQQGLDQPRAEASLWLAQTLLANLTGDEETNRQRSETLIRDALDVLSCRDAPLLWGQAHASLAIARAKDPNKPIYERMAEARELFEIALQYVSPDEHPYEFSVILTNFSVATLNGATIPDFELALSSAAKATSLLDPKRNPDAWIAAMRNLANIYQRAISFKGFIQGEAERADFRDAYDVYEKLLAATPRGIRPADRAIALAGKIEISAEIGDWNEADAIGQDLSDTLRSLLACVEAEEEIRHHISRVSHAISIAAFAAIQLGDPEKALRLLDSVRSVLARRAYRPKDELTIEQAEKLAALRQRLSDLRAPSGPFDENTRQAVRSEIFKILSTDVSDEATLAPPDNVCFLTIVTVRMGGAIILKQKDAATVHLLGARDPVVLAVQFKFLGKSDEAEWRWEDGDSAQEIADLEFSSLWDAIDKAALPRGTRIVWTPPPELARTPICAARHPQTGEHIIDRFDVSFAPSFSLWERIEANVDTGATMDSVAGIFNPAGDLNFAEAEEFIIKATVPGIKIKTVEAGAEPLELLKEFSGHAIWHFATHNNFDWARYLSSGIELGQCADGERKRLTIEDLKYLAPRARARLILLSVCDSAIADVKHFRDEALGLPTAFLSSGATGVIASHWEVFDLPTAIIVARLYQNIFANKMHPAAALGDAQRWLRDASGSEIYEFFNTIQRNLEVSGTAPKLNPIVHAIAGIISESSPFADAKYWSGFAYYGA